MTTQSRSPFSGLDHIDLSTHGQHAQACAVEFVAGRKVRYRVDHDTSFWYQSSAVAEVWDGDRWNEAATYLPGEWAGAPGIMSADQHEVDAVRYAIKVRPTGLTGGTELALEVLRDRIRVLLG